MKIMVLQDCVHILNKMGNEWFSCKPCRYVLLHLMVAKQSVCDYFSILARWWMAPKLCTFSFSKANNGKLIKPNLTVYVFILVCQSDCGVHSVCRFTTKSISAILLTVWSQPSNHLLTNTQRQTKKLLTW